MCTELNIGDAKLDEIVEAIKENNLSRNNFPKIIVGTDMSASFGVPWMWKLANELDDVLSKHKDSDIALVIVSQRPAELNTTIISQCNNIISLKITNERDKGSVSAMMTDSLVGLVDMLPNLDVGEYYLWFR